MRRPLSIGMAFDSLAALRWMAHQLSRNARFSQVYLSRLYAYIVRANASQEAFSPTISSWRTLEPIGTVSTTVRASTVQRANIIKIHTTGLNTQMAFGVYYSSRTETHLGATWRRTIPLPFLIGTMNKYLLCSPAISQRPTQLAWNQFPIVCS